MKTLVAYFSASGTTESVAKKVAEVAGADLFEIKPEVPYTSEDLNYNNSDCRAEIEQNDSTSRPEIANQIADISTYDTLILGYPILVGQSA